MITDTNKYTIMRWSTSWHEFFILQLNQVYCSSINARM